MKKAFWLLLLLLFMPTNAFAFTDIENNTHRENIELLHAKNIIKGHEDDLFRPNEPATRGEALFMMKRLYERSSFSEYRKWLFIRGVEGRKTNVEFVEDTFTDVHYDFENYGTAEGELYSAVYQMHHLGVMKGYPDQTIRVQEPLTRLQVATMLQNLLILPNERVHLPFTDVKNDTSKLIVGNLYANNLTTGTSATTFSPNTKLTRGQLASFIARAYKFIHETKVEFPVTVVTSDRANNEEWDWEHYSATFTLITTNSAAQYDLTADDLKSAQYVRYVYSSGGCGYEIAGFTFEKDALNILYKSPMTVTDGIMACTADIRMDADLLKFDSDIDLQQVTVNGVKPIWK